jgi:hypothetical protein
MAAKEKAMNKIRKKLGEASTMGVPGMLNAQTDEEPYVAPLPTLPPNTSHPSPQLITFQEKIFGPVSGVSYAVSGVGYAAKHQSPEVVTARQCL